MNSPSLVSYRIRPWRQAGRVSLETAVPPMFGKEGVFRMKGMQDRGPPRKRRV